MTPVSYKELRAFMLDVADTTPGFDRVRAFPEQTTRRLDGRTGQVSDYPRQQRRARDRHEASNPVFSGMLEQALAKLEPGEGLFMHRRYYATGFPIERRPAYADYSSRYQALFNVL